MKRLRLLSIVFGLAAYIIPAFYFYWRYSIMMTAGVRSGLPYMAEMQISFFFAGILSGIGASLGIAAWMKVKNPRPRLQLVEIVLVGLPAAACFRYICSFIFR
ncbi:MAG: hypothetical protein HZB23_15135 [Deltaproteobacteria bacterium]|nr:hypothetical protein [Deltaproteobacteria bacterium]